MKYDLKYSFYGKKAVLIQWPEIISDTILKDILIFKSKIEKSNIKRIIEVINGYNSIVITFDKEVNDNSDVFTELKSIYKTKSSESFLSSKTIEIPVCYSDKFSPDLESFSKQKGLSKSEIIDLHTSEIYTVFFIGFLPGFLYLGGLKEQLYLDRKASPKLDVKKGSVGIGGKQTGIYPQESPGGWHIIGNCPIDLFDVSMTPPCFINAGDNIKFVNIDKARHKTIKEQVLLDNFDYKTLVKHA
ncbi:5-oxoprolinase subunit PxpB [Winogradskyella sp.]|uniref:5-oxoprolinase subunit PxpB n=1 Tax=Winogradskyella sp. TaxID=1883156 RepID=UPI003F6C65D7